MIGPNGSGQAEDERRVLLDILLLLEIEVHPVQHGKCTICSGKPADAFTSGLYRFVLELVNCKRNPMFNLKVDRYFYGN